MPLSGVAQTSLLSLTKKNVTEKQLTGNNSTVKSSTKRANADFLSQHWQQPIQAVLPTTSNNVSENKSQTFTAQACAACHPQKFIDWQGSLHADAMSVGVMVQLKMLSPHGLAKHYLNDKGCMHCHAPTKTQQDSLLNSLNDFVEESTDNSVKRAVTKVKGKLHQQGVVCIACHVRNEHWFGPGSSNKSSVSKEIISLGHPKSQANSAFQSAQFCSNCHQFPPDGPSLSGKLIQNTFNEWQASQFSEQGVSCQNCHMPEKRHLFRGIHNKDMVLSGLKIQSEFSKKLILTQNKSAVPKPELKPELKPEFKQNIEASLTIKNTGVGHHFPTYVTPRVILRGYQIDNKGVMLEQSLLEYEIMRAVSLDLSDEYFDSRLAAGESYRFDYQQATLANAMQFVFTITIDPDYFYQQFFTELLTQNIENIEQNPPSNKAKSREIIELLEQAKAKTDNSSYLLFSKKFPLH